MRFTLALTFLLGASAVKIQQKPVEHPVLTMLKAHTTAKKHEHCPTEAELAEMEEAMKNIESWTPLTKEDAAAGIQQYAESKGHTITEDEWAQLEAAFDYVDKDGNKELSKDEILAVEAEAKALYEEHCT